jgi:PBP1b-binding outer membrane lipoprotein LpoB
MLERILKSVAAILIACLLLPGCSHFSSSARKQAAYQKYVSKHMSMQAKARAKYQQAKYKSPPMPSTPSEPKVTARASDGPQSVTSAESQTSE